MSDQPNYVQKSIQLKPDEAEKVMEMAENERRSFSNMAGILMQEGMEARNQNSQKKAG